MTLTITRATKKQLPQLLSLVQELAAHHNDTALATVDQLRADVLGEAAWMPTWIAQTDAGAVGYMTLLRLGQLQFGARVVDLHHLCVTRSHRGHGIGRALCLRARAEAQRMGAAFLVVSAQDSNTNAHAFYSALGMERRPVTGARFRWDLRSGA